MNFFEKQSNAYAPWARGRPVRIKGTSRTRFRSLVNHGYSPALTAVKWIQLSRLILAGEDASLRIRRQR